VGEERVMLHEERLNVKMTSDEKRALSQLASRDGVTVSDVVRRMLYREARREGVPIKVATR
jgi:antitoxin component of RelBE/YafQ-DinJ toxin-antitoxin module